MPVRATGVQDERVHAEPIGRDAEVAVLQEWLADPWGRLAVLEGEAGIGKTTVWRHACSLASGLGYAVVTCSPSEAERQLVFAGLADLLGPLLPEPAAAMAPARRRAIEAALLLGEAGTEPPEERAVAFAVLDALRLAGRRHALVLAIDDAQWLDRSSTAVVSFALRRLVSSDRVTVMAARRSGIDGDSSRPLIDAVEPDLRTTVTIGPLSLGAVHRLYRQRLGLSLPRPRLLQIQEKCAGNPLFALEIGRALASDPVAPWRELPIPSSLTAALGARLSALTPAARRVALVAAAAAEPTTALLVAASNRDDTRDAISEVVGAGIFAADDDGVRFGHPLLASAAYAHGSDAERREAHGALAGLVDAPEERARHLALGKGSPDATAAAALDLAADKAEARGAQAASGELREWAAEMTPAAEHHDLARRLVAAGRAAFVSGDAERARTLLERVAAAPGPMQHEALWRLGTLLDETGGGSEAREYWLQALATEDLQLRVHVERSFATTALYTGSVKTASSHSTRAVEAAERLGDPRVLAYALATDALARTLAGDPQAAAVLARAVALE
nr:AAA family ATPase [Actinomycetota bacterium]